MNSKPKLWTKDFLIIASTNFFVFLTFYVLMVTLTIYTVKSFHTSTSLAGLASSIFVLGAVLVRPLAGKMIDQVGRKKLLLIGLIIFFLSSIVYFQADSLTSLFVIRFIHGIAFGLATTATGTISASIIPDQRRGEGMGYFAMSTNLAMAFGPFIGLFITQHFSYNAIFMTAVVFSGLSLAATLFLKVPKVQAAAERGKSFKLSDFFEKTTMPIALLMLIIGFIYSSILSYLSSYAEEINLVSTASFFFVSFAIFLLISRPFTGRMFDIKGENKVIYPSLALFAIGLFLLSQTHIGLSLLIAGAIIGVGYGTFQSSAQTIAVQEAPRHRIGLATSTFFVFFDTGIGVGPFILGFAVPYTGFRGLYLAMAGLAALSILVYYFVHGKKAQKRKSGHHASKEILN
nr:MFS transporter [Bacillus massiliglaciei]